MSNNWSGVGCPEIGQMVFISNIEGCEVNSRFNGKEVRVEATFHNNSFYCIAVSHRTLGLGAMVFKDQWVKPIKSDRDKAIEDIALVISKGSINTYHSCAERLYDAGYRKIDTGE